MKFFNAFLALVPLTSALSLSGTGGRPYSVLYEPSKRDLLQDIITWDEHSLFIRGERAMMYSGELHPFRIPVPELYLDIFQKIKALGFNLVSFYIDWALLEGKAGEFRAEGIFDFDPFFDAAKKAGIYLLARPGPYINAEVSGGGFPGWLQRIEGKLRTSAPDYLNATDNYMANICSIIAKAQITNGGPVILYQPENEYSLGYNIPFPDGKYFQYVIDQARKAGIVVPLINNDAYAGGHNAPGTGVGEVDIYGHDSYPLGFDCAHPYTWPANALPTNFHTTHLKQSPKTPFSIIEFQGGSYDPFGGYGFDQCSVLVNHEFARVFYKNNIASGVTIVNLYMIYGGTNWGNLGHPNGYTSYDYGASIREDRYIDREKYSEVKLEAQFSRVSPGYLTTDPAPASTTEYGDNEAITITPLFAPKGKNGNFFVVRHTDYQSTDTAQYTIKLPTSQGVLSIPQHGGKLTLSGRDSKVHVTDYPVGKHTLLYSTGEIFTWQKFQDKTILILYGGAGELHEFAVKNPLKVNKVDGKSVSFKKEDDGTVIVQWTAKPERQTINIDDLTVYMLDRNSAYDYWVPVLPGGKDGPAYGTSVMNPDTVIINGGYFIRSVSVSGSTLSVQADFNKTTTLEIIGAPKSTTKLSLNGESIPYTTNTLGNWITRPNMTVPNLDLPDLNTIQWHAIDSLPELSPTYSDSKWQPANKNTTTNPMARPLRTPVSLYGSDYGFNTGTLVFRGYFTSSGKESSLAIRTQGGLAFGSSVWLNNTFLGSAKGNPDNADANSTYPITRQLVKGHTYVLTVLVDNMGHDENLNPGYDSMKGPRGIVSYGLTNPDGTTTNVNGWKLTGNLGGESYADRFRGPLNEGGFYFERQGYHLPSPPLNKFHDGSPFDGLDKAGVTFYVAKFPLHLPTPQYDIPLSFTIDNSTSVDYRAILYINGFQFGKYVSYLGPQSEFPVPEGILNYNGDNWIGLAVWAQDDSGAKIPKLTLKTRGAIQTSRNKVNFIRGPSYQKRDSY